MSEPLEQSAARAVGDSTGDLAKRLSPVFASATIPDINGSGRTDRILRRARREVVARDLIVFALGRMWLALLAIGAAVYKVANQAERRVRKPKPVPTK